MAPRWIGTCDADLRRLLTSAVLAAMMLVAPGARACFDLEPLTPAERGAATRLALGMVEGSADVSFPSIGDPASIACYGFKPFGLGDIDFGAVSLSIPLDLPVRRVNLSYQRLRALSYVEETYETSWLVSGFDLIFCPTLRLGTVRLDGELLAWTVLPDLALETRPGAAMRVLVDLENPFSLGLRKAEGMCPTAMSVGLGYLVTPWMAWGGEIRKQGGRETCISIGFEWAILDRLNLRAGLRTYPEELCLGTGLHLRGCKIDIGTSANLDVGTTHEFGVAYVW